MGLDAFMRDYLHDRRDSYPKGPVRPAQPSLQIRFSVFLWHLAFDIFRQPDPDFHAGENAEVRAGGLVDGRGPGGSALFVPVVFDPQPGLVYPAHPFFVWDFVGDGRGDGNEARLRSACFFGCPVSPKNTHLTPGRHGSNGGHSGDPFLQWGFSTRPDGQYRSHRKRPKRVYQFC